MPGPQIWSSKNCSPTDKNLLKLKLPENIHVVMVDNCYIPRVALQVTTRGNDLFLFLEICIISSYIARFPEIVVRRSGDLQTMMPWLVCREISLTGFLCRQTKSLGTINIQTCLLKFFSTESGPYKIQVCKCRPQH